MKHKRSVNLVSIAIWMMLFVVFVYFILTLLHNQFGLLGSETKKISGYSVEFVTKKDNDIKFEVGKRLYLYDSREFFCYIVDIVDYDEHLLMKAKINGFYKNDTFYLNGKHYIAKNSKILIMNNQTEIRILNIY